MKLPSTSSAVSTIGWNVSNCIKAHLPQVLAIEQAVHLHPWTEKQLEESLHNPQHTFKVLLHINGTVLAYAVWLQGVEEAQLLNLAVAKDYQAQGLAKPLLQNLQGFCQEHQLPCIWLEVRASNQRAVRLYQNFGFEFVGLRKGYYPAPGQPSQREDALLMRLSVFCPKTDPPVAENG